MGANSRPGKASIQARVMIFMGSSSPVRDSRDMAGMPAVDMHSENGSKGLPLHPFRLGLRV
jgi:hypothetical protein